MDPKLIKEMLRIVQEGDEVMRTAKVLAAAGITERLWRSDPLYRMLSSPYSLGLANALRGIDMGYSGSDITLANEIDILKYALRQTRVLPKPPRE